MPVDPNAASLSLLPGRFRPQCDRNCASPWEVEQQLCFLVSSCEVAIKISKNIHWNKTGILLVTAYIHMTS
jgi:hypothetical protein